MIQFEDAKRQVESLYGPIRGYKAVYQNFINYTALSTYSIGANYIFVGCVNIWTTAGANNSVYVSDINGVGNPVVVTGIDNNGATISSNIQTLYFLGADYDYGGGLTLLDFSYTILPNCLSIYGWVFQIDK